MNEVTTVPQSSPIIDHTVSIVCAALSNSTAEANAETVQSLISSTYMALNSLGTVQQPEAAPEKIEPVVSIRASVKPDYLICLYDGKKMKMLKRYLANHYGDTPESYRAKFGLPADYPMVAPNYSERRRELAKTIGLGRQGRGGGKATEGAAPARRGRKPKAAAAAPAAA